MQNPMSLQRVVNNMHRVLHRVNAAELWILQAFAAFMHREKYVEIS